MRKLASVQRVLEKKSIVGADLIEAYRVNGWWVVDKKCWYSKAMRKYFRSRQSVTVIC